MRTLIPLLVVAFVGCADDAPLLSSNANQSVSADAVAGDSAAAGDALSDGAAANPNECSADLPAGDVLATWDVTALRSGEPNGHWECAPLWVVECVQITSDPGRCRVDACRDAAGCWSVMLAEPRGAVGTTWTACECAALGPSAQCDEVEAPGGWWYTPCGSE